MKLKKWWKRKNTQKERKNIRFIIIQLLSDYKSIFLKQEFLDKQRDMENRQLKMEIMKLKKVEEQKSKHEMK